MHIPRTQPCLSAKSVTIKHQDWFIPALVFLLIVKIVDSKQARASNSYRKTHQLLLKEIHTYCKAPFPHTKQLIGNASSLLPMHTREFCPSRWDLILTVTRAAPIDFRADHQLLSGLTGCFHFFFSSKFYMNSLNQTKY